jgi:hypothetical protein
MDEEILEERPRSLNFTDYDDDFRDTSKRFLPIVDFVFESGEVSGREHGCYTDLILFKHVKVFF